MGEFPARITSRDFVTPPELSEWRLAAEGSGRIGGVRFALEERTGRTQLTTCYEQIPVRLLPLKLGPEQPALIYLLNPTAGLMDGDGHLLDIHAGPGTRAVVTGQSATRLHPCWKGFCTQQWKITVADGAILVVLPGPTIPFQGSRFFQRVSIELGKTAQLVWGDVWFAGRYARQEASERFRFERIVQELQVQRHGRLIYRDRFSWQGPWDDETARWHFGDFPAIGTLFATGNNYQEVFLEEDLRAAFFPTVSGDTCCRWTGPSEAVIRAVVRSSLRLGSVLANQPAEQPWLLTGHHLARTHWFDVV